MEGTEEYSAGIPTVDALFDRRRHVGDPAIKERVKLRQDERTTAGESWGPYTRLGLTHGTMEAWASARANRYLAATSSIGQTMLTSTDRERSLLGEIDRFLERQHGETPTLAGVSGQVEVPEPLVDVLKEASRLLARDGAVAVLPIDTQLTPSQAADILNLSRHSVDLLLRQGVLPSTKVGARRRVALSDLVAFKRRRDEESRRALDELSELSQELGVYS